MRKWTYRAYGLLLRCTLALPGMREVDPDGEPDLAVEIADEREVLAGWDATGGTVSALALSDGERFCVERGRGTYLFRYGRLAVFRLHPGARLACAPADASDPACPRTPAWLRGLLDSVLPRISLLHGFEALNASAVEHDDGVLAFVAGSGAGKSALAAELTRRGYPLVSDGALALHQVGGTVWAHPGPPHLTLAMSSHTRAAPTSIGVTIAAFGNEAWVVARRSAATCRPLIGVYVLERGAERGTRLTRRRAHPLVVLPHALTIADRPERAAERFALYSRLATTVPVFHLSAALDAPVSELADAVESGFGHPLARHGGKVAV